MAQIIPPITSLPVDSGAAPSVEDIQDRLPSICVDYLSHNWTEEDVWASWRNMTRHKHEIANGVRLENASWRTWNKQRNKLRTISPETLNWLKDSDVTWLYGPLHTANVEPVRPLKISSTDERLGIDRPAGKGILKHRTLSELLSLPQATSPILEATMDEVIEASIPGRPIIPHTKSETNLSRSNSVPVRRRPPGTSILSRNRGSKESSPDAPPSNKRHIMFNTFVEQVVALDEPVVQKPQIRAPFDSDDDDMLELRPHLSRISSRRSSASTAATSVSSMTIAKIAPTMLKTAGSYTNNPNLPRMIYQPPVEYMSPPRETPPQAVTSSFDIPSPLAQVGNRWQATEQEEEYSGVGFDYFGGPNLTGTSPGRTGGGFGRPPAVQAPPPQPKWRQVQSTEVASATTPSSTSSSSSSLNGILSPQPGRSILKVPRPPSNAPLPESPPAVFNYNPSVATGIGGMYGSYDAAAMAIGSPPPTEERGRSLTSEERGRSTSRGNGSSQYDRAFPRGSSTSSSSSMGSVSRSPVEAPKAQKPTNPQLDRVQEGWNADAMDVDHSPDRSSTPTPHSSPQIVFRPLKDTSPSSLPHTSTREGEVGTGAGAGAGSEPRVPSSLHKSSAAEEEDEDDGSTLIGRATNIANTAKDLLGALWYGATDESGRPRPPAPRQHRRGASLG